MDPQGVVALAGTVAGIAGQLSDAFRSVRQAKALPPEATQALTGAQDLVLSLQSRLLELQEKALALQAENSQLTGQIRENEEWATARQQYKSKNAGGTLVYFREEEPEVYYCAHCFQTAKKAVSLNRMPGRSTKGTHRCPSCQANVCLPIPAPAKSDPYAPLVRLSRQDRRPF